LRTRLVHIILRRSNLLWVENSPNVWFLANRSKALGKNNKLVARDVVFLDRLANDCLADSIGIDIRGIPGIQASIVCSLEERK
jgi:hypothetical protein